MAGREQRRYGMAQRTGTSRQTATGNGDGDVSTVGVGISATERRRTREGRTIEIAGTLYTAAAKTNETMRKLLELQSNANDLESEVGERRAAAARAEADELWDAAVELRAEARDLEKKLELLALDSVYEQIAVLLRDTNGENPEPEKLGEVLDIEDARAILDFLMPGMAEGN
jgi:hypothetical protein